MNREDLHCTDERRRDQVRRNPALNGLDYLEVSDDQQHLSLYFIDKAPAGLAPENFRIDGGRRISGIKAIHVKAHCTDDPERDDCMLVTVNKAGDFSTYTLKLVNARDGRPTDEPLDGFDPRYAQLDFSFKVNCASDLDCRQSAACPPEQQPAPEINYLAKDYQSFRQLILDRLALVMPEWQERHVADIGIALVEILAYVGDYLSYYQDAVATEAYLGTARQRISVRRHARLVDYFMHEGVNARAWVAVSVGQDFPASGEAALSPHNFYFVTAYKGTVYNSGSLLNETDLREVAESRYEVFEPVSKHAIRFYAAHNEMQFYTWGDRNCCLPKGATTATLLDEWEEEEEPPQQEYAQQLSSPYPRSSNPPVNAGAQHKPPPYEQGTPEGGRAEERKTRLRHLRAGDVLVFEEVKGPQTGESADANPQHRHAVRLTKVEPSVDELYDQPVVEIEWGEDDALPFALCVSNIGRAPACELIEEISVARGNIVLVDHGRSLPAEVLGTVPEGQGDSFCEGEGQPSDVTRKPGRFNFKLAQAPLTFSQPLVETAPAQAALWQDPHAALPQIRLTSQLTATGNSPTFHWTACRDLLASQADDRDFVVEVDDDQRAHLRFGDGELGIRPEAGESFHTYYRIGNGPAGNVGAEAIKYILFRDSKVAGVEFAPRNPMPATGGLPPELASEVKLFAPQAFKQRLERAVTALDYASLAERNAKVQRAAATLRWNGSWNEVLVAIDEDGQTEAAADLLSEIERDLRRYRRIGHDLSVRQARYVPLQLTMAICVKPDYLRGHVRAALLDLFSNRRLANGRLGYFHPDNLTFKEGIAVSKLVALAQSVEGVEAVKVTELQRQFEAANDEIENGFLPLAGDEIARLDNDPNYPENGVFKLDLRGGR